MTGAAFGWAAAWRLARRDLHVRFRGLRLLFVCLFLGVAALAAIGSLSAAIQRELNGRGQVLLGGDIEIGVSQRAPTAPERAAMAALGRVSHTVRMQAMAILLPDGGLPDDGPAPAAQDARSIPVELKGVDARWPLYGKFRADMGGAQSGPALRDSPAPVGNALFIAPAIAERLGVGPGDQLRIGLADFTIKGIIADEPDRLGEGLSFGAVALTSQEGMAASGLIQPGSMVEHKSRIALAAPGNATAIAARLKRDFAAAGWEVKTRDRAAPGAERFVSRMGQFLILVGLTALVIAGIGIGNGVDSYLQARRGAIATLKILGAGRSAILRVYLLQILIVCLAAIAAGLLVGILVQPLLVQAIGNLLPVPQGFAIYPQPLAVAAGSGLAIALTFAAPALLRAAEISPLSLLRDTISAAPRLGWQRRLWPVVAGIAVILLLVLGSAEQPLLSAGFMAGAAALFVLLHGLGWALLRLTRRLPRPSSPILRQALANIHRPGARSGALVVALGLGLTMFVLLAAIQSSLTANIAANVPRQAPDYFVLDLPLAGEGEFRRMVKDAAPASEVATVPAMRGIITAYGPPGKMIRVADLASIPENAWALRGERGLTYSATLPAGNSLIEGEWWPADYTGAPLVSIDADLAKALDLGVGDAIAISLLGVERQARIASLRQINWQTMGFNYVLVFSPNAIADAPHNLAATIRLGPGADRGALSRAMLRRFPSSSQIEVGSLISQAQEVLGQMTLAITAAAAIAILAGIAVLIGALAAARAARSYDSVVLKTLGATRRQLLAMQAAEFALLASLLALVALALGLAAAWLVVTQLFSFEWLPDWGLIIATLLGGAGLVMVIGLLASLPVLRARPAEALRSL